MGLDIGFSVNNYEEVFESQEYELNHEKYFKEHSLSRTFCNLIFRNEVISHKTELDQISEITNIDLKPLFEMAEYPDEGEIDGRLMFMEDDSEKEIFLKKVALQKQKNEGNIQRVNKKVSPLLQYDDWEYAASRSEEFILRIKNGEKEKKKMTIKEWIS